MEKNKIALIIGGAVAASLAAGLYFYGKCRNDEEGEKVSLKDRLLGAVRKNEEIKAYDNL